MSRRVQTLLGCSMAFLRRRFPEPTKGLVRKVEVKINSFPAFARGHNLISPQRIKTIGENLTKTEHLWRDYIRYTPAS